jgi:hypothetical protein
MNIKENKAEINNGFFIVFSFDLIKNNKIQIIVTSSRLKILKKITHFTVAQLPIKSRSHSGNQQPASLFYQLLNTFQIKEST